MIGTSHMQPVTVLICTANNGDLIGRSLRSVLANTYPNFRVIVVDQSVDDRTGEAVRSLLPDERLHYIRDPQRAGKGAALNLGLAETDDEIVVCTDDDCVVPADWLERVSAIFEREGAALVFGSVEAAPHDPALGFIPAHSPARDGYLDRRVRRAPDGMGACMAFRRSAIETLGGFDPAFGPGSEFRSGDDRDIALRALIAGLPVYETTEVTVTHYGFRRHREGRQHARRAWHGMGGMCAKLLKTGHWRIAFVAFDLFVIRAMWPVIAQALRLRRPAGLTRMTSFAGGFARGLRTPVRRDALIFDTPADRYRSEAFRAEDRARS